ncbi:MAG: ABC transporter ATP-binding protein [Deltaproteobacteria bacterium]
MSALELSGIEKSLGGRPVLCEIDLSAEAGEVCYVIGRSGAGKSVLARIALGLLAPDRGVVRIAGQLLDMSSRQRLWRSREGASLVLQGAALLGWLSLEENVALPLRHHLGLARTAARLRARSLLAEVGLEGSEAALPGAISAGARQRAGVARALGLTPRLLVLDEPTSGLDPVSVRQIDDLVRAVARRGAAVLVVSHDMTSLRRAADRVVFLRTGHVRFGGRASELRPGLDDELDRFLAA